MQQANPPQGSWREPIGKITWRQSDPKNCSFWRSARRCFANSMVPRKEDFFNHFFLKPFLDKTGRKKFDEFVLAARKK